MFDAYCPEHGGRVLIPASHIVDTEVHPGRVVVKVRCWCGTVARVELIGSEGVPRLDALSA